MNPQSPLFQIRSVSKRYMSPQRQVTALHACSLELLPGETLGLVGESGCGKSTIGRCLIRLEKPDEGEILYKDRNIFSLNRRELNTFRQEVQMVFQDPYGSLNPRMNVTRVLEEPLKIHRIHNDRRVDELLDLVGLPRALKGRLPHELSGGQRQRVGIARALALNPQVLICDEPISSLDVSVQAQIVNLMKTLQKNRGLTYLFIAHHLPMVRYLSDRVAVMYLGHLVELAPSESLYLTARHPYTQALLKAIPIPDPVIERQRPRLQIHGDASLPSSQGCPFASRCPQVQAVCRQTPPPLKEVRPGHLVACHLGE